MGPLKSSSSEAILTRMHPLSQSRYSLNSPAVASQVIDGETILIQFDRGRYYSVGGLGCELFEQLVGSGRSPERLVELLVSQFEVLRDTAKETVARYVQDLVEEELIVTDGRPAVLDSGESAFRFASSAFATPVVRDPRPRKTHGARGPFEVGSASRRGRRRLAVDFGR
jgi:hypothetical protein